MQSVKKKSINKTNQIMDPERCCVCLSTENKLQSVTDNQIDDLNNLTKLQDVVYELKWLEDYQICYLCETTLNQCYLFRKTCIENNKLLKQIEIEVKLEVKSEDNNVHEASSESENTETVPEPIRKKKRMVKNFSCEVCLVTFQSAVKVMSHCIEAHNMSEKEIRPYECELCHKRYRLSTYWQHLRYHKGEKMYICEICGKGFVFKNDLGVHEKTHSNKREFKCEPCQKSFNTRQDLRMHNFVVHTSPSKWKHVCSFCGKRFPVKSNYDKHVRNHLGEKPFGCHLCEKSFADKCGLRLHLVSHSNVRQFKCDICEKEFKTKKTMRGHRAKAHHTGECKVPERRRNQICHICSKAFQDKIKLARHICSHTGERPHACPYCDRKFTDKSYVTQHIKNSHPNEADSK